MIEFLSARQRTVGLELDLIRLAEFEEFFFVVEGAEFNLVYGRNDLMLFQMRL